MPAIRALLCCMLLACISLLSAACASGGRWVELAGQRYAVEIADTEEVRAHGLMFRDHLDATSGMLFIHDREEPQTYWMMNTRIALDILYFDNDLKLVTQQRDAAPCASRVRCPGYPSRAPARYVLEVNAGEAARLGLKNGERLLLGPGIRTAD